MSTHDVAAADALAHELIEIRRAGKKEAKSRTAIHAQLASIFPDEDDQQWLRHYREGEETHTKAAIDGRVRDRFIDTLVNATVIEYEKDLANAGLAAHGLDQLSEQTSGLLRAGERPDRLRALLSDGVLWIVYDVATSASSAGATQKGHVTLTEVERLDLEDANQRKGFADFLRRQLGRRGTRRVSADALAADLGLRSLPFVTSMQPTLLALVKEARAKSPAAELAISLWAGFVDHLNSGARAVGEEDFSAELYLSILARLFCANVLEQRALVSTTGDLTRIVGGDYFRDTYQLHNVVERDYFWWTTREPWNTRLLEVAGQLQRDLAAYDFAHLPEGDLFGQLMAELADASQRQLLGQEWTPRWLAVQVAKAAFDRLPARVAPRLVDMCCGSGAILAEVLREARSRGLASTIDEFVTAATGFDVDALAVVLAKTTWVLTLAAEIRVATSEVVIPIYHADSLFASAPTTKRIPIPGSSPTLPVDLDGQTVHVPAWLVGPEARDLFDRSIDWAYESALEAERNGSLADITVGRARGVLDAEVTRAGLTPPAGEHEKGVDALHRLARRMGELAIAQRDGIWAFILRNVYRPGLLTGQFNGLVSNPPWLALSRLAANPYQEFLRARAASFGILPPAEVALHLELATTYLLHAVDRFLSGDAAVACVLPGTVLNGAHHQPFRDAVWTRLERPLPFVLSEVWEVAEGTFKYPAIVAIGRKFAPAPDATIMYPTTLRAGRVAEQSVTTLSWGEQRATGGKRVRTAWRLGVPTYATRNVRYQRGAPAQGADLMPRTAVVVEVLSAIGAEWKVNTPTAGSARAYAVADAKQLVGEQFPGRVAPEYLYDMVQSNHVLPFVLDERPAPVVLPAVLDDSRAWHLRPVADVRAAGHAASARRFRNVDDRLAKVGKGQGLLARIGVRGKLTGQQMPGDAIIVLYGAGGTYPAAAWLSLATMPRAVFDQTVYWHIADSVHEARFIVAMLNSPALNTLASAFNPEGSFGGRHLHTVPFRLVPLYDAADALHVKISTVCESVEQAARHAVAADPGRYALTKPIARRRSSLRAWLEQQSDFATLRVLTEQALSTAHP